MSALGWALHGQQRPSFAETPGPGQVSCFDFPRPPRIEQETRRVTIVRESDGAVVADTTSALAVLETSHAPSYYLPKDCFTAGTLVEEAGGGSVCEWKGSATYHTFLGVPHAAWSYERPSRAMARLAGHISLYANRPGYTCLIDGVPVIPQPGGFYGGWIPVLHDGRVEVVGPVKGAPGTGHW
mmetsp:Transcript_3816/g.12327  ORF Transcript_3816/g.12327 Transcript_3816/m.12327 type:complete len:183 (-) Transcript_3816:211-759(-)